MPSLIQDVVEEFHDIKRDTTGDVQFKNVASGLTAGTTSGTTTLTATTNEDFNFSRLIATAGTGTTVTLSLLRDGSLLTSVTDPSKTSVVWNGSPNVEGGAKFTAIGKVAAGSITLGLTAKINDKRKIV